MSAIVIVEKINSILNIANIPAEEISNQGEAVQQLFMEVNREAAAAKMSISDYLQSLVIKAEEEVAAESEAEHMACYDEWAQAPVPVIAALNASTLPVKAVRLNRMDKKYEIKEFARVINIVSVIRALQDKCAEKIPCTSSVCLDYIHKCRIPFLAASGAEVNDKEEKVEYSVRTLQSLLQDALDATVMVQKLDSEGKPMFRADKRPLNSYNITKGDVRFIRDHLCKLDGGKALTRKGVNKMAFAGLVTRVFIHAVVGGDYETVE